MRFALAQISPCVGDFSGNLDKVLKFWKQADENACDLVIFPELTLSGYPPHDLLDRPEMIEWTENALAILSQKSSQFKCSAVIGHVGLNQNSYGKRTTNRATLMKGGRVVQYQDKMLLPTYDVFDEARYFQAAESNAVFELTSRDGKNSTKLGVTICEDLWGDSPHSLLGVSLYGKTPVDELASQVPQWVVSLSASPYEFQKHEVRLKVHADVAKKLGCPVIYVNQVGATDEILFDGRSFVLNGEGKLEFILPAWEECLKIYDSKAPAQSESLPSPLEKLAQSEMQILAEGLVLGIREYFRKTGFQKGILGLSGGIDSAVVACLAAKALGSEQVLGVAMPSQYSSPDSLEDAEKLAKNLGIRFEVRPIKFLFSTGARIIGEGLGEPLKPLAQENLQSRLRAIMLMTLSNHLSALTLTTGNKSELAMGYCTLYGDQCGALGPIGDLFKTKVYALADWINLHWGSPIPVRSIDKAPSAELRPNQKDEDSLPPYEDLDLVLYRYLELGESVDAISKDLSRRDSRRYSWVKSVIQILESNEFKRRQAAPVLKVSPKAFGLGRRIPIAKKWRQCDSGAYESN